MTKRKSLTDAAGEVRELSDVDLAKGIGIAGLSKPLLRKLRQAIDLGMQARIKRRSCVVPKAR